MTHPYLMNTVAYRETVFVGGNGSYLWNSKGERFLDFFTDTGTACHGYGSPEKREALKRMAEMPLHAPNLYPFAERDKAAERLCKATEMDKVFFCNSGTEAVECALKLGRKTQAAKGRSDIWSYKGGFHGRTYGSMAATDSAPYHKEGFGPHLTGFHYFENIEEIDKNAAMVILAPVFGNNDSRPYPDGWLVTLREYTKAHGILLCFDEVQTGSGRVGAWTLAQKLGIKVDIVCLAKGLGMGMPVGACLSTNAVAEAFTPGVHFSTFGGNPVSSVFINAMVDWLTPRKCEEINEKGAYIKAKLAEMGWPTNIRGEGLMLAFEADVNAKEFALLAEKRQLILGAWRANPIKLTPPLIVTREEIDAALEIIAETYKEMKGTVE
jgi:acetylornithine/N-succinyldiaminopimelate aminotransferase